MQESTHSRHVSVSCMRNLLSLVKTWEYKSHPSLLSTQLSISLYIPTPPLLPSVTKIPSFKFLHISLHPHPMKLLHPIILFILMALLIENGGYNANGARHHHHSPVKKHKHSRKLSPAAPTGAPAPAPATPYVPSDPSYDPTPQPDTNVTSCVFDVTEFGAVGDGSNDDTTAFRAAWKAACQVEDAVVLVPSGLEFMITSTIFSGPCQPGLVFQVRTLFFSL